MPAVDVDVGTIPDIIEAQLTLSYSRLTDLIRVIVEQGNGHEDDIVDLRQRLDKLQRDNAQLRDEVESLRRGKEEQARLAAQVQELAKTLELQRTAADARHAQAAESAAAHDATVAAARADTAAVQQSLKKVQDTLATQSRQLHDLANGTELCRAFTDLWAAQPAQLREMASREVTDETNPGGGAFEYSVEERTKYLHTLPAFTRLYDELDIVRSMMQRQAADALTAKMTVVEQASRRPSQTARGSSASLQSMERRVSQGNGVAAPMDEALQAALHALEQRVKAVELHAASRPTADVLTVEDDAPRATGRRGSGVREPSSTAELAQCTRAVDQLSERVSELEERLRGLLRHQVEDSHVAPPTHDDTGVEQTEHTTPARAHSVSVAWSDLDHRVQRIEHVLDGLPHPRRHSSSAHAASGVLSTAAAVVEQTAPERATPRPGRPRSASLSKGGGSGSSSDGRGRPPTPRTTDETAGAATLPPLSRKTSSPTETTAAASPVRASTPAVAQPHVAELRRRGSSLTARETPSATTRRISVAVEPDDGLRRRVIQVEENVAILELNKADREELRVMESALRDALRRVEAAGVQAVSHIPHKPNGTRLNGGYATESYANGGRGVYDEYGAGAAAVPQHAVGVARDSDAARPQTYSGVVGRPVYVSGSSIYLRDGSRPTNASISPAVVQ